MADAPDAPALSAPRRSSFARDAVLSVATQIATQSLVLATGLIMPRIIAPDVKGAADSVMSLTLGLIVFDNLGLSAALVYHPMRRERSLDVVASTALTTALIVGSISAGILGLLLPTMFAEIGRAHV